MRALLHAAALIAAFAPLLNAIEVSSISGSLFTEKEFEPGRYTIKRAAMTADAICEAFGVSRDDYLLDCDPAGTNFLVLRPRPGADTNLSAIIILQSLDSVRYLREWKAGPFRHEMSLSSPVTSVPLFNAFRGTALARVGGSPTPSGGGTLRVSYEVTGSSSTHILKFKFTVVRSRVPGRSSSD